MRSALLPRARPGTCGDERVGRPEQGGTGPPLEPAHRQPDGKVLDAPQRRRPKEKGGGIWKSGPRAHHGRGGRDERERGPRGGIFIFLIIFSFNEKQQKYTTDFLKYLYFTIIYIFFIIFH